MTFSLFGYSGGQKLGGGRERKSKGNFLNLVTLNNI